MALETQAILDQIDAVLERCGASAECPFPPSTRPAVLGSPPQVQGNGVEMSSACIAAIERLAPSSSYPKMANDVAGNGRLADYKTVKALIGILVSLRRDVEAGFTRSLEELVHADVFADFLDMASELLRKGYKDPAAVLAGSALESHLRKLAGKHVVSTHHGGRPKKAETMNADLVKVGAYNKIEQKSVSAWLGIRNDAAHGNYGNYDRAQVEALVRDVQSFMSRNPA